MALQAAQALGVLGQAVRANSLFGRDDGFDLAQEPGIVAGDALDLVQRKTVAHRLRRDPQPVGRGARQRGADGGRDRRAASISSKPVRPVSSERSAFCRTSAKVRPMAMASPTDFIEVVSSGSAPGNFSKAKRGILVTT